MSNRVTKTISVFSTENGNSLPYNVVELIAFLQEQLAKVPEEYRTAAVFDADAHTDWDGYGYVATRITYDRPETDDEVLARLKAEQLQALAQRDQELAELARLQAKYPTTA
jgi:hypothetical protein